MNKLQLQSLCTVLDSQNEAILSGLVDRYPNIGNVYVDSEYRNIMARNMDIHNICTDIIKFINLRGLKLKNVCILDFGCGIGNILQIFATILRADPSLSVESMCLVGAEKIKEFADHSANYLGFDIPKSDELHIFNADLTQEKTFNDISTVIKNFNESKKSNEVINIAFCNRPFKDSSMQYELQQAIDSILPKGNSFNVQYLGHLMPVKEEGIKVYYKGHQIKYNR